MHRRFLDVDRPQFSGPIETLLTLMVGPLPTATLGTFPPQEAGMCLSQWLALSADGREAMYFVPRTQTHYEVDRDPTCSLPHPYPCDQILSTYRDPYGVESICGSRANSVTRWECTVVPQT